MQRSNKNGSLFKQKFWYFEVLTVLAFLNIPAIAINYFEPEIWYVWYALTLIATSTTIFSLNKIRRIEMFKSPTWTREVLIIIIMTGFIHQLLLTIVGGAHHDFLLRTLLQIPAFAAPFLIAWLLHQSPEEKTA